MAMDGYYYGRERKKKNPSFSSTLLDEIYLSIDKGDEEVFFHKETMRKKNSSGNPKAEVDFLDRSCMIEKWMENKVTREKVAVRRKSAADFETKVSRNALFFNSSSSSSDSSSGSAGGFSYSDAEYCEYNGVLSSRSSCYGLPKPKPIKTTFSPQAETFKKQSKESSATAQSKPQQQGGYLKTKSRALKIYGDLKKVKQPISPGGKLASFLNTLFTTGNAKKAKISSTGNYDELGSKSANASTCSSASSFSRSCLSKTPSSRGKSSDTTKRSVRFYPVSVIVDEDCQPCGHKNVYDDRSSKDPEKISHTRNLINEELKFLLMEKNRRVEDAARNLLGNYQKKLRDSEISSNKVEIIKQFVNNEGDDDDDDDEDDDAASYASSDLFELDNLSATGNPMERYFQELPVYETTHLHANNRSIANGFIL